ncbi:MAG: helix-turn-helix transcriptional regulator [Pseudomonadota bacterium]
MNSHDALIQNIYDAATDEAAWSTVPELVTRYFGAAAMYLADGQSSDPTTYRVNSYRFDSEPLFQNGFEHRDHFDSRINLCYRHVLSAPLAKAFEGRRVLKTANEHQKLFYRSCLNGMPLSRIFAVNRNADELAGGFLTYGPDVFEGKVGNRFDTVLSHVRRAVEIRSKLDIARRETETLGRRLDGLSLATFVIDQSGRSVFQNELAEELARQGDGLIVRNSVLRATDKRSQRMIEERLRRIYDMTDDSVEGPIQLRRTPGRPPLLAWIYPTIGFGLSGVRNSAYACLLVRDPAAETELVSEYVIIEAFDLTLAEARVARLTPLALPVRQIADHLGISPNTVKTHLSNVRDKLAIRSTAQIGQIISKLRL